MIIVLSVRNRWLSVFSVFLLLTRNIVHSADTDTVNKTQTLFTCKYKDTVQKTQRLFTGSLDSKPSLTPKKTQLFSVNFYLVSHSEPQAAKTLKMYKYGFPDYIEHDVIVCCSLHGDNTDVVADVV